MENAVDALKMAGGIFIFVLAVSIIIISFANVRQTTDTILDYRDWRTEYEDYPAIPGGSRKVNLETIIPAIFRVYLENYRIVFADETSPKIKPLYKIKGEEGDIEKYSLDLETNANYILFGGTKTDKYRNVVLANDDQKIEFLKGILYRDFNSGSDLGKFEKKYNISLTGCEPLIQQLKSAVSSGKSIYESLGIYYQDDNPNVPEVNKTEKRIITYTIKY